MMANDHDHRGAGARGRRQALLAGLVLGLALAGCAAPGGGGGSGSADGASPVAPGGWNGVYRGVDELVTGSAASCVAGGKTTITLTVRNSDARFEITGTGDAAAAAVNALGVIQPDGTIRSVTLRQIVADGYSNIEFSGQFRGEAFYGESISSPSGCRRKLSLGKT